MKRLKSYLILDGKNKKTRIPPSSAKLLQHKGESLLKQISFVLPEIDRKATQSKVEQHLEQYRLFKYLDLKKENSITTGTEIRYHGLTNTTSDQTSNIAIYNADQQKYR